MFKRLLGNIKHRSNATLRAWSYQCESILAQRSRRIQQLCSFYQRVYGPQALRQLLLHTYRRQLQPPLHGILLSAVGIVGLNVANNKGASFDWASERLSVHNYDMCVHDLEFIESLPSNTLCDQCAEKNMKYCYCQVGNKKCRLNGKESVRNCRSKWQPSAHGEDGKKLIETADEVPWEPYFSKNQFSVWKREERPSMYAYKVYAHFDDITAADILKVQTDLQYRKQWDNTAAVLEVIETDPAPATNSHLIYWEMRWPTMFANRDYVYTRRFDTDDVHKVMMIMSRGTRHPKYPATSSKVRVLDYWSFMVIKPYQNFNEPGLHYILTYYDDPGLSIPPSIQSWVTQKQMPDFLQKMYVATKQYASKHASAMQKKMHKLSHFNTDNDNEYTANAERSSKSRLGDFWRKRESGK